MLTVVAIDLGPRRVRLCKWDGMQAVARAMPARPPADAWSDWLRAIDAPPRHEIVFRCTNKTFLIDYARHEQPERAMPSMLREAVNAAARSAGARWVRFIGGGVESDPGMAAARHLADRTRWTSLLSVERDDGFVRVGLQDRRGTIASYVTLPAQVDAGAKQEVASPLVDTVIKLMHRPITNDAPVVASETHRDTRGLVCLGDGAHEWSRPLVQTMGTTPLMVPPNPETWPLLGLMIAPIELQFRREMEDRRMTVAELRAAFVELMDAACDAITREGYDLDDAESSRLIDAAECDNGGPINFETVLAHSPLAKMAETPNGAAQSANATRLSVRALCVRSIIRPTAPDWPIDVAPPLID